MWEAFFGFKKTPFSDRPDAKQLFASAAWQQVKTRLEFLTQHPGVGLLTGEVGAGKSTAARGCETRGCTHYPVRCPTRSHNRSARDHHSNARCELRLPGQRLQMTGRQPTL